MSEQDRQVEEAARLDALRAIDLELARPAFDRIAFLVQCFSGTPIAQVDIVEMDQIWRCGVADMPMPATPRAHAFANRAISGDKVLWVEDATQDRRFHTNPLVVGEVGVRFYAGAPIRLSNGVRIGAVSIMDRRPRPFDAYLAARLEDFAAFVAEEWDGRRSLKDMRTTVAQATAPSRRMATLIDTAPVGLMMTDLSLRILRVSPRWLVEFGMDAADVVGANLESLIPGGYAKALAGETIRWNKLRLALPNKQRPWIRGEAAPWRDANGVIGGLLVKSHDVTDIVETLEAAERSEQRLRLATDMAGLMVWEADVEDLRLQSISGTMEGLEAAEVAGEIRQSIWRGVHPADRPAAEALWRRYMETGEPFRTTYRLMRRGGPHIWVASTAEVVLSDDGRVERIVGVLKNIDHEKRAEQAMAKALEAAESANRAKTEFLANMSHEIRTPLNGVMGIASVLGRTQLTLSQREMVDLIGASAHTLEAMLSDVLDLARIEAGRLELRDEPFDLGEALSHVAGLFELKAKDKGLMLKTAISPAARTQVRGDAIRLRQIVSNLLSNAVKFTDQGRVSLHVEAQRKDARLSVRMSVIDTGIGFDAETGARLFQRFEQADGSITRRFGGTGLGLAISKSLADAMGGSLSATGTPGKGAVFTFELELACVEQSRLVRKSELEPYAALEADLVTALVEAAPPDLKLDAPPEVEPKAAPKQKPPGPRVLLAEDHPTNRKVVSLILGAIGADLTSVENGEEAVLAAGRESFDIILMDMQMPVMDGLTAIAEIRAQELREGRSRTPILALTANAMAGDARASEVAGADGHLTKPIAAEKLIGAILQVRKPPHLKASIGTGAKAG
jgi:PAS domain S-box-containing protein